MILTGHLLLVTFCLVSARSPIYCYHWSHL